MPPKSRKTYRRKNGKSKRKRKNQIYVKDSNAGSSNMRSTILDISKVNPSPVPMRRNITLKWNSYVNIETILNQPNRTYFLSIMSLFDPNYGSTPDAFTNTSSNGYTELFGLSPLQYRRYIVNYVDIKVKLLNTTPGTVAMVCCGSTTVGDNDYTTDLWIQNIAGRRSTVSKTLEYFGDSAYQTITFRVYPWKALGITKREYYGSETYNNTYNANAGTAPWVAFSIGDGASRDGVAAVINVKGQVWVEQHVTANDPNLRLAD